MKSKNSKLLQDIMRIALGTLAILLIPLIAMQFTHEVNWSGADFIIVGILLFGAGLLVNLVLNKVPSKKHRFILVVAITIAFLYIWAELAVGIFTNWGS